MGDKGDGRGQDGVGDVGDKRVWKGDRRGVGDMGGQDRNWGCGRDMRDRRGGTWGQERGEGHEGDMGKKGG